MRALALHRFLLRFALAAVAIYAWVFAFHFFVIIGGSVPWAFAQVALLYALSAVITALSTPLAARAAQGGARRSMTFAVLCAIAALVVVGSALQGYWGFANALTAIALFAILLGLYRALYWIPYELEAAAIGKNRLLRAELLIALAPLCGGLFIVLVSSAPIALVFVGAAIMVLSLLPLGAVPDVHEKYSWGYRQTFHELISREHSSLTTHAVLEGVAGAALLIFWPLAIFLIMNYSYAVLGLVLTLTFIMAILLRAPVRALVRRAGLGRSRLVTTTLAVTPWLFRLAVAQPFSIVLVDSYFYTTTPRRMGIDPFAFEQFSDGGTLVDEYTAIKEIGLNIGRAATCALAAWLSLTYSIPAALVAVFLLAAIASAAAALRR